MIGKNEYSLIAESLGSLAFEGEPMYHRIGDALHNIEDNDAVDTNIDKLSLLRAISGTYSVVLRDHLYLSEQLIAIVESLQEHVVHRYGSVDAYLVANNLKVTNKFAVISNQVGYPISSSNIS